MQNQAQRGRQRISIYNMLPKISSFQFKKKVMTHTKIRKVTHTQGKKAGNRSCVQEGPDVGLSGHGFAVATINAQ